MHHRPRASRLHMACAAMLALALTATQAAIAQTVPDTLQPAGAHRTIASLSATGVQIYVCKRDGDKPPAKGD